MQHDLTQGPILRHVLSMAAFMGLTLLFQTLYFLVDLYFVSRLGSAAIAGVSTAGSVFFLVMGSTQLINVGAMALIAQAMGAKEPQRANLYCNQAVSLGICLSAVMVGLILLFGGAVVDSVGADAATDQAARDYLFAFTPGLALMYPSAALGGALRASGVVGPPMVVQTASIILNALLAPVLIAGWLTGVPLGVAGAGLASTIAGALSFVALVFLFPRVQSAMRCTLRDMKPRMEEWGRLAMIGAPATVEFLLMFIVMGVVYFVISDFGPHAQAGYGVGSRVMQSIFLPVMAVAFAAGPIAGQNFGARNAERVRETFKLTAMVSSGLMVVMTVFAHWRPELLVAPFAEDPAALEVAADYLKIASWNFVASGLVFTCSSMFQGLGDTRPMLLASASRLVTFAAPALWLAQQPFVTLRAVWYLSVGSIFLQMLLCLWLLDRQLKRKLAGLPAPA